MVKGDEEGPAERSPAALPRDEAYAAALVHTLLLQPQRWTHRRVESIEVLDDRSICRSVSLDLSLDEVHQTVLGILNCTPVTLLRKEVLRNFDLRDREGRPVPMLNKQENGGIAGNALIVAAEGILGNPPSKEVEQHLRRVATAEETDARAEIAAWKELALTHPEWKALLGHGHFVDLADTLAGNFILFACLDHGPTRQILKLSYEEAFGGEESDPRWKRLLVRFGWRLKSIDVDVPAVSFSSRYHLEVAAPSDLEIDSAQLRFQPAQEGAGPPPEEVTDGEGLHRAHLYASEVGAEFRGRAVIFLRRPRDSYLWSAALTALLLCLLLAGGLIRLETLLEGDDRSQTAAALLLITPTLLAAYIARPDGHALASKVLLGVRVLVVGTAFCAIVAVGVLAAGYDLCTSRTIWTADLVLASVIAMGLVASLILPRPTGSS